MYLIYLNFRLSLQSQSNTSSVISSSNNQISNNQSAYSSSLQLMPYTQQNTHAQNTVRPLTPDQLNLLYSMNTVQVGYGFQRSFINPGTYQNYNQYQQQPMTMHPSSPHPSTQLDMHYSTRFNPNQTQYSNYQQSDGYSMKTMQSQSTQNFTTPLPIQNTPPPPVLDKQQILYRSVPQIKPQIPQSKSLQAISNIPSSSQNVKCSDTNILIRPHTSRDLIDLGVSPEET